jgi:hypothetical protein
VLQVRNTVIEDGSLLISLQYDGARADPGVQASAIMDNVQLGELFASADTFPSDTYPAE